MKDNSVEVLFFMDIMLLETKVENGVKNYGIEGENGK